MPGKRPGVTLAATVPEMSVSQLKQLWPFTAAGGGRRWAMKNLFGGQIKNGKVQFRVPPGRLGNGVPLSADEVFGHVDIADTRFDITGRIPPMRDAAGSVDFRGNDVDVALQSGATYLPDGGKVSASNGVFTIRNANKPRVVGKLEIDIAGDASSVTQLASYDPIDAMARTGMTPGEFSGEVAGHVTADIPLVGDVDTKDLSWLVDLDYYRPRADQGDRRPSGQRGGGKHHCRSRQGGDQGQGQAERRAGRGRNGRADRRKRAEAKPQHRHRAGRRGARGTGARHRDPGAGTGQREVRVR